MRESKKPSPNSLINQLWLRRTEQWVVVVLILIGFAALAGSYWQLESIRNSLIDIDVADDRSIRFVVDVNSAEWPELAALPGIGPKLAQTLVERRQQNGKFRTLDDLLAVPGIGSAKLEAIRPYLMPLDASGAVALNGDAQH